MDHFLSRGCNCIDLDKSKCIGMGGRLDVYDWLNGLAKTNKILDIVEVQFKNTRKGFYRNVNNLSLERGDVVAVEASPGHDIGVVTLVGELVFEQMLKMKVNPNDPKNELKKIYRKAKPVDVEKWQSAIIQEDMIMLKAREIAQRLNLNMKIGDVEFQGDRTKAIFYYIADDRVDFRELIKVLADEFKVRVEMRQIGARQEAGRIGGISSCGRELCCATWMTNFSSVTTGAARAQELSPNPLKLAGQCGKLKCCLNYELDTYLDARKDFPSADVRLQTKEGMVYCQKIDVFRGMMWFSSEPNSALNLVAIPVAKVKEIIEQNKRGIQVEKLSEAVKMPLVEELNYTVPQDSLTRFDKKPNKKNKPAKIFKKEREREKNEPEQQIEGLQEVRQETKAEPKKLDLKTRSNDNKTDFKPKSEKSKLELKSKNEPKPKFEPKNNSQNEPKPKFEPKNNSQNEPKPKFEPKNNSQNEPKTKFEPKNNSQNEPKTKFEPKSKSEQRTNPISEDESKPKEQRRIIKPQLKNKSEQQDPNQE